jgi:hypothetical protein
MEMSPRKKRRTYDRILSGNKYNQKKKKKNKLVEKITSSWRGKLGKKHTHRAGPSNH